MTIRNCECHDYIRNCFQDYFHANTISDKFIFREFILNLLSLELPLPVDADDSLGMLLLMCVDLKECVSLWKALNRPVRTLFIGTISANIINQSTH